jgi:hypothetical protein
MRFVALDDVGASEGAAGRALGFALTAYPTFGRLATVTIVLAFRLLVH